MRIAILVCAMASAAFAAPRYNRPRRLDPTLSSHVRSAEQAWTTAEREPAAANQPALWEQAADAFAEVDGDPVDDKVKREAAYAAMLAWKNALAIDVRVKAPSSNPDPVRPTPLPARELKLIGALDRYVRYADPTDPELPDVLFFKARTYSRFDQTDTAIPIYRTIIDRYPQHQVAEYAAVVVLDSYNRLARHDQLVAFADKLAADPKFLRGRNELAATVAKIRRQAARKRIETLEAAARADKDLDNYAAVGTAYLELYNAQPRSPDGDELLYNAGVAFESGGSISAAIEALALLQRQYPNSRLRPRSVGRLAQIYARTAIYDKAANLLEEYAMKYAGEQDAYAALSDAVFYRKALGDREKAIADTNYFIKTFGAKKPREAADASWSLTALYDTDPDRALAQLRGYLRDHGAKGGIERVVIAHAKIGQLLWKQSCPFPATDGLCVKPNDFAARTCGSGTTRTLTATVRDQRKVKEALVAFASAIKEFERGPIPDAGARYYYAQAKLAMVDTELEAYLALALPRNLDFDRANNATRTASIKQFSQWTDQKQKAAATLNRRYESILEIKDAVTTLTAAARLGIVGQSFASSLVAGDLPRDVRSGPNAAAKTKAYCDAMTEIAQPLEASAVQAFEVCLAKSTQLAWFGESSRQCERELTLRKPAEFPRAIELRSQPLQLAPIVDIEPPPH